MYAKLVFRSAKRSVKEYLVYLVTMTICVTLFYSFLSISSKYYQPDIGVEYNFRILGDGMKYAICSVTLLLLFLISYVNQYMLRSRQKEFALQAVMGMEQKAIGDVCDGSYCNYAGDFIWYVRLAVDYGDGAVCL